jgi:hypothetical protein
MYMGSRSFLRTQYKTLITKGYTSKSLKASKLLLGGNVGIERRPFDAKGSAEEDFDLL